MEPGATDLDAIAAVPAEQYEAQRFLHRLLQAAEHLWAPASERPEASRTKTQPLRHKTDAFSALGGCTLEAVCGSSLLIAWSQESFGVHGVCDCSSGFSAESARIRGF